jgi:hypothetical protein
MEVIRRKRERGLPEVITNEMLHSIGVPEGNAPRTLQTLKWLHLIQDDGYQTPLMERIGKATTEEYTVVMSEMIRGAYQAVFTLVDPAKDEVNRINDAFRQYQPEAQRPRMIALFIGLCQESGLCEKSKKRIKAIKQTDTHRVKEVMTSDKNKYDTKINDIPNPKPEGNNQVDYRAVSAIIQLLPTDGKWTKDKRDKWIQAVTAAVDLTVDIIEPSIIV